MNYRQRFIIILIGCLAFMLACGSLGLPFTAEEATAPPLPTSTTAAPSASNGNPDDDPVTIAEPTSETLPTSIPQATTPPETDSPPTAEPTTAEADTLPSDSADLAERQIFILPGGDPPTLDPHLSGDATSAEYVVEIFSGLMAYDQELNLIPDIAESYDISEDGLVYTFKIREAAKFQDGKPIRAGDFKWSFERACDPATGSHTADTYLGDIIGCRAKLQGEADEVAGVVVLDDLTLQLTIDQPKGFFLAKMTYPTAYVLDQANVESGGVQWYTAPNGSGPFVLDEFAPDESIITLVRNENFYRQPQPILERVIYLVNAPVNPMTGYEQGLPFSSSEVVYDAIEIGSAGLSAATDPNNPLSKEFRSVNSLSIFYIGFNVAKPPFDEVEIRQAFNLALDKRRIVKIAYQGAVPVANGIVPPNMPGYENPDLSDYEFDPEQALALIAESSYGDPSELPDITLHVSGVGGSVGPVIESVVESYKINLGIEIAVEQSPWPEFLNELNSPNPAYQMYQLGWVADYPDPQNFLEILFHSESTQNHGDYSNPELDALLDQAKATRDEATRLALYQQAEQMILDDAAWVPIYFDVETWLVKPYVKNFQVPPLKIPKWQYVYLVEQ